MSPELSELLLVSMFELELAEEGIITFASLGTGGATAPVKEEPVPGPSRLLPSRLKI